MHNQDEIPVIEIHQAFDRLAGVFGGGGKIERAGWTWAIQSGTRRWSLFEFRVAVKHAAAHCRFFPKPKDIVDARPFKGSAAEPEQAVVGADVCASCQQHFHYAGFMMPSGIVQPRLRCGCKHNGSGWDHPDALAWRESDRGLVEAGYTDTVRLRNHA
jgi:hypothetical protein